MRLRAFVPVLNAQSAAVAIRMLERLQQFEEYERFWRVRPQVRQLFGLKHGRHTSCPCLYRSRWPFAAQRRCFLTWRVLHI